MLDLIGKVVYWVYDGLTMYDPFESASNCLEDVAHVANGDGLGKSLSLASGDVVEARRVLTAAGIDCWAGDRHVSGQGHLAVKAGDLGRAMAVLRRNGVGVR